MTSNSRDRGREKKKHRGGTSGFVQIVNGKKEYISKSREGAIEPTSGRAGACLPWLLCRWSQALACLLACCVSWGTQKKKKYTNPTEGAFLAGLGPPTHGSLFKPPPILYSSVRGGLLTQPNSTHTTHTTHKTGLQSHWGGRAHTCVHTNSYTTIMDMQTHINLILNEGFKGG